MAAAKKKAAPKAKAKAKAKATKEGESKGRRSKFESIYPEDAKLTLVQKENPKKAGSAAAERYEAYKGAKKVRDALQQGATYQDIAYDVGRGFIAVG